MELRPIDTHMRAHGWTRYAVFIHAQFVGEVFSYRNPSGSSEPLWAAQAAEGTIYTFRDAVALRTRTEAATLLKEIGR